MLTRNDGNSKRRKIITVFLTLGGPLRPPHARTPHRPRRAASARRARVWLGIARRAAELGRRAPSWPPRSCRDRRRASRLRTCHAIDAPSSPRAFCRRRCKHVLGRTFEYDAQRGQPDGALKRERDECERRGRAMAVSSEREPPKSRRRACTRDASAANEGASGVYANAMSARQATPPRWLTPTPRARLEWP